ncbi:CBS domain containing-hemolysin-like protein [Paenibacillus brasilensis]|uniref:CBS domain containing-hemolysin-like protein n=1 Tax=Paenibacillus brasilensis TaxID=128574 RepID=A0ABU0L5T8_9BACL|nr:CBS domain containing-hemolysin-like protein [Paenibacillus brasilensis]
METINIILVILLIALTAFFVASEYSIIRVRVSRINQLASEGNKNAKAVKNILSRLDEYLSACQLGTTLPPWRWAGWGNRPLRSCCIPCLYWRIFPLA